MGAAIVNCQGSPIEIARATAFQVVNEFLAQGDAEGGDLKVGWRGELEPEAVRRVLVQPGYGRPGDCAVKGRAEAGSDKSAKKK